MKKRLFSLLLALCMVATLLPLTALADDKGPGVWIRISGANGTVVNTTFYAGGAVTCLATDEEGNITKVGADDEWNIKIEYPADGNSSITLKGAAIKANYGDFALSVGGSAATTICVEADSVITSENRTALWICGTALTTLTGSGKLSISTTDADCIVAGNQSSHESGELLIKDANLDLKPTGSSTSRSAIGFTGKDLVIDNSKINITSTSQALGIAGYARVERNADGKITKIGAYWTPSGDEYERNLTIQNGSVVTGNASSRQFLAATGKIIIKDSTIEGTVGKSGNDTMFNKKPTLEGEYTAVGGTTKERVVEYNPSKALSYKYIKIVPGKVDLSELGVVTVPTTQPTTQPVTEPTTAPTTEPTTAPTTEPTTAPTVEATTPATNEATKPATDDATEPGDTTGTEGGMSPATLAVLICTAVIVVGGGAFAVLALVIKPKWLMKALKK